MRVALLYTAIVIAALSFVSAASATTLYVDQSAPGPTHDGLSWETAFLKIGQAVAAIPSGGTADIRVAAGTYNESVSANNRSVALYGGFPVGGGPLESRDWVANKTTIRGNATASAVRLTPFSMSASSRVDGFTITNGAPGIYHTYGAITIIHNRIVGNVRAQSSHVGGLGISCEIAGITNTVVTIEDNVVVDNVYNGTSGVAGGIYCSGGMTLVIRDNTITDNIAGAGSTSDYSKGGGIYAAIGNRPTGLSCLIEGNTVLRNRAKMAGGIGGTPSSAATVLIRNNTVSSNIGGGIQGATSVENCVVTRNVGPGIVNGGTVRGNAVEDNQGTGIVGGTAEDNIIRRNAGVNGGGIGSTLSGVLTARRNIITDNTATLGGGIYGAGECTIEDNTIEGNRATQGGGILLEYVRGAGVSRNTIRSNVADDGGGIYSRSSGGLTDNMIEGNQATRGGGVMLAFGADGALQGNTIQENTATLGGGVMADEGTHATITANMILGNSATQTGAIYSGSNECQIDNNVISGNVATESGGAIACAGMYALVTNNTLVHNLSPGGAISQEPGAWFIAVYNNIVAWNTAGITLTGDTHPADMPLDYNCVYDNNGADYTNLDPGTHDVNADPLLVDPENGDFHLTLDSPCIDAGANPRADGNIWYCIERVQDFEGDPRYINTCGGPVAIIDIGADEYFTGTEVMSAPQGWFGPGWTWFSIPDQPLNPDAVTLLGYDGTNRIYGWDSVNQNLLLCPNDFTDLAVGQGYLTFINLGESYTPSYEGTPMAPGQTVTLHEGWNWVGLPSNHATRAMKNAFVTHGNSTSRASHDTTWVNWNWVWWDPIDRTAKIMNPMGGADDDTVHPWYGYRVWAYVDEVTITFPTD